MAAPYWRLVRTSTTRVFIHASARAIESNRREQTQPRVDARDTLPWGRAQSPRPHGASKGARRKGLRRAPSACWQDGGWKKRARTSCWSGSETVRRSTTAGVQGISPVVTIFKF